MSEVWMRESSQDFWAERACHLVFRYDNLEEKRQNHERNNEGSEQKEKEKQEIMKQIMKQLKLSPLVQHFQLMFRKIIIWTFWKLCFGLDRQKLLPRYSKWSPTKHV